MMSFKNEDFFVLDIHNKDSLVVDFHNKDSLLNDLDTFDYFVPIIFCLSWYVFVLVGFLPWAATHPARAGVRVGGRVMGRMDG